MKLADKLVLPVIPLSIGHKVCSYVREENIDFAKNLVFRISVQSSSNEHLGRLLGKFCEETNENFVKAAVSGVFVYRCFEETLERMPFVGEDKIEMSKRALAEFYETKCGGVLAENFKKIASHDFKLSTAIASLSVGASNPLMINLTGIIVYSMLEVQAEEDLESGKLLFLRKKPELMKSEIEEQLKEAVEHEHYERAARLRDELSLYSSRRAK